MNSIWWQVAGWTMIHFLWIGSLVFLGTALVRLVLFRAAPQWRYAASLLGLAVLAVSPPLIALRIASEIKPLVVDVEPIVPVVEDRYDVPLVASNSPATLPEVAPPAHAVIDLKYTPITVEVPSVEASLEASPTETLVESQPIAPAAPTDAESTFDLLSLFQTLPTYLPWLWMIGTPATLLLLATGLMGSERLRRRAEPITDPALLETLARLTVALRIGGKVSLSVSDRVLQPVLVGIVRPLVLLPSVALTSWSPAEIEMALVHELAHVRRWDNLVNLVQRLVESLLFFHPAVWITSRWVRADREHCCDAVVVAHCGNREAYASLLVSVAKSSINRRLPSPAMAMASHPLDKRVRRILQLEDDPMLVSKRTLLSVAVLLAALTAGAVWSSTLAEEAKGEPEASAPGEEEVTTEGTEDAQKQESIILHPDLTEAEIADIRKKLKEANTGYTISVDGPYVFLRSDEGLVKATRIEINGKEWRLKESESTNVPNEEGAVLVAWFQGSSFKYFVQRTTATLDALIRDGHVVHRLRNNEWGIGLVVTKDVIPDSLPKVDEWTEILGYSISAEMPMDQVREVIQLHEQAGYMVAMEERGDRVEIRVRKNPDFVAKPGTTGSTEDAKKSTDQQVATTPVDQPKRAMAAFYFANVGVGRGNEDTPRHAERIARHDSGFTSAKTLEEILSRLKLADAIDVEWLKNHLKVTRVNDLELQVSIECGPQGDISQGQVSEIAKEVVNAYLMRQFPSSEETGQLWSVWHLHPKMELEDFEKARKFFRENSDWTFRLDENLVFLSARGDVFVFDEILIVGDLIIGLAGSPQSIQAFAEAKTSTAKDETEKNWSPINPMVNNLPFLSLEDQRIADLAYGMLGVEVAAIDAEELAAVKEKGFAGGVRLDEIPGYGGMSSSPAAGARLVPGDVLVGLHIWPTANLDQLAEVLRRGDLNQFIPLKYFVLRKSTPGKFGEDPNLPEEDLWKLHTGRVSFDNDKWRVEQQRLKQIELKAEQDAGMTMPLPLPGQPGAVKVEATENKDVAEPEVAPPAATAPIAEPAEAEPIKPSPPQLLYDGRTFDDWRTEWKTELKTENRTEAIKALRAFGRAGYGKEATEAILEVAQEYPMTSIGHEGSPKETLQTAIVYSFVDINDSSPIPSDVSIPVILDWYDASQENRVRLAAWVLSNTASKDVKLLDRIAALADNSTMALDVLQHLIASDPKLNQERTQKVLTKCLASDDQGIAVGAIMSLMPRRMVASASGNYESVVELRTLPTSLPPLLFNKEPRLRQYARLVLNHAKPEQLEDLPELLMTIAEKPGASAVFRGAAVVETTDDAKVLKARRLDALRALAAIGPNADAMSDRIFALFAAEDADTKKLGEWVIRNLHTTKLPHGGLLIDVPKEIYDRIEEVNKDQPDLRTKIDWNKESTELFPQDQFGGGGGFGGDQGGGGMF